MWKNRLKLLDNCIKHESDGVKIKTKTANIYNNLNDIDSHETLGATHE